MDQIILWFIWIGAIIFFLLYSRLFATLIGNFIAAAIFALLLSGYCRNRRWKRTIETIAAERQTANICQFARSFDYRNIDTWIIRATYEELQATLKGAIEKFHLLATDRFKEDLDINPEDIIDIAFNIAERANYDMSEIKNNPLYDKIITVGDLVFFLSYQPKLNNAEQFAQPDSQ